MRARFLMPAAFALLAGCNLGRDGQSVGQYAPNMYDEPWIKTQGVNRLAADADSGMANVPVQGMRMPAEGSLSQDYQPFPFPKGSGDSLEIVRAEAGRKMSNPLPRTAAVLERGQAVYRMYCAVCHGTWGTGDGPVVNPFPKPASLQSTKIRAYPDAAIFHVVWYGGTAMPSYSKQILARDIWAAIHYIRAVQKAYGPVADDAASLATDTAKTSSKKPGAKKS
jgi:mono/diheme cytochrome c family protein